MARKQTDREKLEQVFANATEADARHLLDVASVIVRARFPQNAVAKRTRKAKPAVETQTTLGDKHQ